MFEIKFQKLITKEDCTLCKEPASFFVSVNERGYNTCKMCTTMFAHLAAYAEALTSRKKTLDNEQAIILENVMATARDEMLKISKEKGFHIELDVVFPIENGKERTQNLFKS